MNGRNSKYYKLIKKLREESMTGLDFSHGNKLCEEAANVI
jgi:hypothetical protein